MIWLSLESVLNDRNVVLTQRQNVCFLARCLKLVHVALTHAERIHAQTVMLATATDAVAALGTVTDAAHTASPGIAAAELPVVMSAETTTATTTTTTTREEVPLAFGLDAVREAPVSMLCQLCEGTLTI